MSEFKTGFYRRVPVKYKIINHTKTLTSVISNSIANSPMADAIARVTRMYEQ